MARKLTPVLLIGALALVAVFGALTYQKVAAQEETPTPTVPQGRFEKDLRGGLISQTSEDLAAALGITQAQADQILSETAGKSFFGWGGFGFDGPRGGRRGHHEFGIPQETQPDTDTSTGSDLSS